MQFQSNSRSNTILICIPVPLKLKFEVKLTVQIIQKDEKHFDYWSISFYAAL